MAEEDGAPQARSADGATRSGGGEHREQNSVLSGPERKVLDWLIPRMPDWVTPDLLTGGALASMAIAGIAYSQASEHPALLHVVNLCLFIHWLGDSTDGGLARFRGKSRPRYGYYVDHMSDAIGAVLIGAGAAVSGIMSPWLAVLIVTLYLLLAVHSYLSTYALGVFHLSYGGVGPTELRLVVALFNLAVLWSPTVSVAGLDVFTFDLAGGVACVALLAIVALQVARTTISLHRMERV
ncbi:MAG: CDP-alcohol phosphatidyltransferase family protein [Gemmatimonadota bacterium]|nr:CDP-alcohol phosphatidyltransferase family protein [Gemmatimonadota bacterium]